MKFAKAWIEVSLLRRGVRCTNEVFGGKFARVTVGNTRTAVMASNSLQHYTKTSVIDCKINDASDPENKVNHSDLDDAENVPEEVTKCSSSSKRTALARKVRLRSSSDEEESDLNPSKTAKESPLAVQIISDSTDSEMEHSNSDDDHNMAQRRKKRKTRTLSDDEVM